MLINFQRAPTVPQLKTQINEKKQAIKRLTDERAKLVAKGSEARMARLAELTKATDKIRSYVRYFTQQEQQLLTLQDVVKAFRASDAPEALRKLKERHAASGLEKDDWNPFLLDYTGAVSEILTERLGTARKNSAGWKGTPVTTSGDDGVALISDGADLEDQTLLLLEAETARIQRLVNADKTTAERFGTLSKRIDEETAALARIEEKLADAEGAQERVEELLVERESAYNRVFDALLNEVSVLEALYSPLKARLDEAGGSLKKVSFSVSRLADCAAWAEEGESLLDLRKSGDFKGQGTLQKLAEQKLKDAWEHGDTAAVSAAMKAFREDHQKTLLDNAQVPKTQAAEYRVWLKQFAQWLYGTGHITVRYSVNYDGVDIRKLSPGTRGIVLLLLYLALDDADDRPLIIDQPEENLDPKSVFDELVGLFLAARTRRQVIIVTHNANLVVNTDADQIIVASAGQHAVGSLPPITYTSGGLETEGIRKSVCDILEGGEPAFRERARRLRVRLDR